MTEHLHPDWDPAPIVNWLLEEGRFLPSLRETTTELGDRLQKAGAPFWRVRVALRTVHPLVTAISVVWERGAGLSDYSEAPHGLEGRPSFVGSPMEVMARTGAPYRKNLALDLDSNEHVVLHELKERGATDYLGLPLRYSEGGGGILVFVTDRPGGLSDADIERCRALAAAIAPVAEIARLRHLADAVAAAYLGPRTAERVLGGQITLGHIDKIEAAILVSDLRGWTAMNAALPPEETVRRINQYFELLDIAIAEHGGEVLKLLGDGILAIFPSEVDGVTACNNALAAAYSALDASQGEGIGWDMQFGIGLHYGQVLYGNVGSAGRLDFTVMGQAVNVAARLEPLCAQHNLPIICSGVFADRIDSVARPLGTFDLKGVSTPETVYGL